MHWYHPNTDFNKSFYRFHQIMNRTPRRWCHLAVAVLAVLSLLNFTNAKGVALKGQNDRSLGVVDNIVLKSGGQKKKKRSTTRHSSGGNKKNGRGGSKKKKRNSGGKNKKRGSGGKNKRGSNWWGGYNKKKGTWSGGSNYQGKSRKNGKSGKSSKPGRKKMKWDEWEGSGKSGKAPDDDDHSFWAGIKETYHPTFYPTLSPTLYPTLYPVCFTFHMANCMTIQFRCSLLFYCPPDSKPHFEPSMSLIAIFYWSIVSLLIIQFVLSSLQTLYPTLSPTHVDSFVPTFSPVSSFNTLYSLRDMITYSCKTWSFSSTK